MSKRIKIKLYFAAFLLSLIMFLIMSVMLRMYPLSGDNTFLMSDMSNQFISFFAYFKNIILTNNNFIYTFSKNLGGDMVGLSAYYLQNPFLFLMLLFPEKKLTVAILIMLALQTACCGLTMMIYLVNLHTVHEAGREEWGRITGMLAGSVAYAFMGYRMAYIMLPIYSCSLIMLPLVMLGLYKIINGGNRLLYIISLALCILFNYYIGYMVCIYAVLYFLYTYAVCRINGSKIRFINVFADFAVSSLIAGGLTAFDVIPVVKSLSGDKDAPNVGVLGFHKTFGIKGFIRNLLPGAYKGDVSNYASPYIYVGMIMLIMVLIYFVMKKITLKEKAVSIVFLIILFAACYINTFDVIWHGFNEPVGFSHRQAFVICFTLIHIGSVGYMKLCDVITEKIATKGENTSGYSKTFVAVMTMILVMCCVDVLWNAADYIKHNESDSQSDYEAWIDRVSPMIKEIRESDASLYRVEKDFEWNHNDAMQFGYNGLSHNSSCEDDFVKNFMENMGFRYYRPIWAFYNQGSTTFVDSFLGVKYYASRFDSTVKTYKYINSYGDEMRAYSFSNPYALPFAFGVSDRMQDVNAENDNLFEVQNDIARSFAGTEDITLYEPADVTEDYIGDSIAYEITMNKSGNLYFYATAPDYQGCIIVVNGEEKDNYFTTWRWNITGFGYFEEGETVNILLKGTDGKIAVNDAYFYIEDIGAINDWYTCASKESAEVNKISSSHLVVNADIKQNDLLEFTIPYDTAWKIKVDGRDIKADEMVKTLGALLALRLEKGEHVIDMKYLPSGFCPGMIVSLICFVVFIIISIKRTKIIIVGNKSNNE